MFSRLMSASWLLGAILVAAPLSVAKDSDDGKSARGEVHKKVEAKKSGDLGERVEALEREVRELAALLKQHHKGEADKPSAKHDAKFGAKEKARTDDDAVKAKFIAKERAAGEHPKPAHVQLVKGKDGDLLVPLSALPPGLQKELLNQAKAGEAVKGKGKGDDENDDKGKSGKEGKK